MKIELEEGKYEIILNENPFEFKALRYGEEWRDLAGDKLILALVNKIEEMFTYIELTPNGEILFCAIKYLEAEISTAKQNNDYLAQNELELSYSHWKQLLATYEDLIR